MPVTLKHIAYITGTSIATVSKVLSGKSLRVSEAKRKEILEVAGKLKYTSDQRFKKSHDEKKLISVVVPDLVSMLTLRLMEGIAEEVGSRGYAISVLVSNNDVSQEIDHIYSTYNSGAAGVILIPVTYQADDAQRALLAKVVQSLELPVVAIGWDIHGGWCGSVNVDPFKKGYLAAGHLLDSGHRKVAYITTQSGQLRNQCLTGFLRAFEDRGIPSDGVLTIFNELRYLCGIDAFHRAVDAGCTALFFTSDILTLGAIGELGAANLKLGETISFVSGENTYQMRKKYYAVDSVTFPAGEVCRITLDMLDGMIKNYNVKGLTTPPRQTIVIPQLKRYGSVCPPRV